jgi:hypothetical protein
MKIKTRLHKSIKAKIDDDFLKVQAYFKSDFVRKYINVDIEFVFEPYNGEMKDAYKLFIEDSEGISMFVYNTGELPVYGQTFPVSNKLIGIFMATSVIEDNIDYSWKAIAHEVLHAIGYKIMAEKSVVIPNLLDHPIVNGKVSDYYGNENPYLVGGNFEQQLISLTPYFKKDYYFLTQEFVSKAIYEKYGENARWFVDPRIVKLALFIRKYFGDKSVTINNWKWGGKFEQRGFRDELTVGALLSQHRFGRGIDFNVKGMTPVEVYNAILADEKIFMAQGLTCMEDIADTPNWNHCDIRDTGLKNILIVKP